MGPGRVRLRTLPSGDLTAADVAALRSLLVAAFDQGDPDDQFDENDWLHAFGGTHVVLEVDGVVAAHASVVEREVRIDGRPLRTGYVEAVASAIGRQGLGFGTRVMEAVDDVIRDGFELGALGTGAHHFYERLGWRTWPGPMFVRLPDGDERRTEEDEGYLMVLRTPTTPDLDETAPISCDWRPGDVW